MPLPDMPGDESSLMSSPGMTGAMQQSGPPGGDQGSQQVTPRDQAKGAVEIVSKLRQANQQQLEGIAAQFPAVSKAAKDLMAAFDRGLQGLVQEIVKTTQIPESPGPRVAR